GQSYLGPVVQDSASWSGRCFPKHRSRRADRCCRHTNIWLHFIDEGQLITFRDPRGYTI
ncbi:hypothetical protein XENOCAPTIV_027434, partial [Xenoophorus captivus]